MRRGWRGWGLRGGGGGGGGAAGVAGPKSRCGRKCAERCGANACRCADGGTTAPGGRADAAAGATKCGGKCGARGAVAGDQPGDDGLSGEKVRYSAEVGGIRQYWPCVTLRMRADALGRTAFTAYGWCSTLPIEPIPAVAALRSLAGLLRGLGLASPLR